MQERILLNSIKCNNCNDILISTNRHDFNMCYCGKVGVDGGTEYLRRIGESKDITDLPIMDDGEHETRRSNLRWGVNYDKDMNRLPKTEWRLIKDLNTEHIKAILDGGCSRNNNFYEQLFKEELEYRLAEKINNGI